ALLVFVVVLLLPLFALLLAPLLVLVALLFLLVLALLPARRRGLLAVDLVGELAQVVGELAQAPGQVLVALGTGRWRLGAGGGFGLGFLLQLRQGSHAARVVGGLVSQAGGQEFFQVLRGRPLSLGGRLLVGFREFPQLRGQVGRQLA